MVLQPLFQVPSGLRLARRERGRDQRREYRKRFLWYAYFFQGIGKQAIMVDGTVKVVPYAQSARRL